MAVNEAGIKQFAVPIDGDESCKPDMIGFLCLALRMRHAIVFCNRKETCPKLARWLGSYNLSACALLPDMAQSDRDEMVTEFLLYGYNILVTTGPWPQEIPAESLHLVFNYDLPLSPDAYAQQVGGCAAKRRALVITLVPLFQIDELELLESSCGTKIHPLPDGNISGLFRDSFPIHIDAEGWDVVRKICEEHEQQELNRRRQLLKQKQEKQEDSKEEAAPQTEAGGH